MEIIFYAAMGWCGTRYPGWWRRFGKPRPDPWRPQPEPWDYIVITIIGIGVGVASGLSFNNTVASNSLFAGYGMIASGLFSFAVSNLLTGIRSLTMKTQK